MNINDPIGDMLTRIRNAQRNGAKKVNVPASNFRRNVLNVLKKEGYIEGFEECVIREKITELTVSLKYFEGKPVINEMVRVSKPGLRLYQQISKVKPVYNGLGINIMSTSKGVMSDVEAREKKVGGELICKIF